MESSNQVWTVPGIKRHNFVAKQSGAMIIFETRDFGMADDLKHFISQEIGTE
jgi:hypothetical protein